MKKVTLPAMLAAALLLPLALQAAEPVNTLLVVPARQRMIQIAFDMQSLRHAEVVSWLATADPESPELNYWTGTEWKPISLEQFRKGTPLARKPQKVIFMGLDIPAVLADRPELPAVARFETFDPAVLVNNLDAFYAFTPGEWRLLSVRYGFVVRDVNERLRQQNRYNTPHPPVDKGPKRPPVVFDKAPAPAKVIHTPPAPTVKPAAKSVKPAKAVVKPAPAVEAPAEIVTPEPVPSTPLEVMKPAPVESAPVQAVKAPPLAPPLTIPAGTNAVPAAP